MEYSFRDPKPYQHQRDTLQRILADKGVHGLLHEPGCGKSRIVVDYCGVLALGLKEVRVLVICPRDVQDTWLTQFETFLPGVVSAWVGVAQGTIEEKASQISWQARRARLKRSWEREGPEDVAADLDVWVVNIDAFANRMIAKGTTSVTLADRMTAAVEKFNPHLLVLDESHRCKGPSGNAARAIAKLARTIPRRLLLTGTPMPHSPLDVWAQWRILSPTTFRDPDGKVMSFGRFKERWAVMGGWMGREITGFRDLDKLEGLMAQRSSVVRKKDALDLPPTTDIVYKVTLTPPERKAYEAMRKKLLVTLGDGTAEATNRLVQMLRLRQIAAGYLHTDEGGMVELGPGKLDRCRSLLDDLMASEHRVVIFAWGRYEIEKLHRQLTDKPPYDSEVHLITGDTKDVDRRAIRAQFLDIAGNPQRTILIAQVRTMSLGVNELVTASHAIFLSQSALRDDAVQARGRLDRPGQLEPVTYHYLVAEGTVDEVMLQVHKERGDMEESLLKHIRGEK